MRPRAASGDGLEYGYQWWLGKTAARGASYDWSGGFGNGGQRLFVVPGLDLVVVVTAGGYNQEAAGRHVNALFRRIVAAADR
jgi:CubicO group peptidase (beta-lactamase class C family)